MLGEIKDLRLNWRPEIYQRSNLDPMADIVKQYAVYTSKMTGWEYDDCIGKIQGLISSGKIEGLRNPRIRYYQKQENGDSAVTVKPLTHYLKEIKVNNELMSGSWTTYCQPEEDQSLQARIMKTNRIDRGKLKKKEFYYKSLKDSVNQALYGCRQTNKKLVSNAFSGIYTNMGSAQYCPSTHPSLTSTIRTVTSIANTTSDRFTAGNRQYYRLEVVIGNILSLCEGLSHQTEYGVTLRELWEYVISKYELTTPTKKYAYDLVTFYCERYWFHPDDYREIENLINRLDYVELCAVCFNGDLWHFNELNPIACGNILNAMSAHVTGDIIPGCFDIIKDCDEDLINLAHHIHYDETRGKGKDYRKMGESVCSNIIHTVRNAEAVLIDKRELLHAILVTDNLPPTIATIKDMVRDAVIMSDTDSVARSYVKWIEKYHGRPKINRTTLGLAASLNYINSKVLEHNLYLLSKNIGVSNDNRDLIKMKSEFTWGAMSVMAISKHYFSSTIVREGYTYEKRELSKTGVALKNSTLPKDILASGDAMMNDILDRATDGEELDLNYYLSIICDIEKEILKKAESGSLIYYRRVSINPPETYKVKDPYKNNYRSVTLWNEVFGPSFSSTIEAPVTMIKVPVTLTNKTKLNQWLRSLDEDLSRRMLKWLGKTRMTSIKTLYLPVEQMTIHGIPNYIIDIIDKRSIVFDLCNILYTTVSALSFYRKNSLMVHEMVDL